MDKGAPFHVIEKLALRLPFWRYREMHAGKPYGVLLDSVSDPEKLGRFSFIGGDPFLVFKAKRTKIDGRARVAARVEMIDRTENPNGVATSRVVEGDLFDEVRKVIDAYRVDRNVYASTPVPFLSGVMGYVGYEAGYFIENLPDLGADDLNLPDIYLLFFDSILAHCHRTGTSYLSVLARGSNEKIARAAANRERERVVREIELFEKNAPFERRAPRSQVPRIPVNAMFDQAAYCRMVEVAKEHIFAGDVFEVCFTQRNQSPFDRDPWHLYQELRRVNPAPFASYLDLPEAKIVSSSPERFLRLNAERIVESRPMKGTRPRGRTTLEDEHLSLDLSRSVKDQAENNMIVDLVRNDLGRVCSFGSIHVPELRIVERYATVHQMVSTIRGELNKDKDVIDLLKGCFPGGSMTGAPKIEAMKIIDRLEPIKRGVYSGAIGYMDFSGPIDFNIVIRTIVLKGKNAYYNVGGAIVADSEPRVEHEETLHKSRALITALENASVE